MLAGHMGQATLHLWNTYGHILKMSTDKSKLKTSTDKCSIAEVDVTVFERSLLSLCWGQSRIYLLCQLQALNTSTYLCTVVPAF